jgi:hypothetical protein
MIATAAGRPDHPLFESDLYAVFTRCQQKYAGRSETIEYNSATADDPEYDKETEARPFCNDDWAGMGWREISVLAGGRK